MHNLFFSRLSSYGNYSVSLEVLKLALYQQNYLHASLSSQVKVGRKAVKKISTCFFLNIQMFQAPPSTVKAASPSGPWICSIEEDSAS